jgi:hypothetical protein
MRSPRAVTTSPRAVTTSPRAVTRSPREMTRSPRGIMRRHGEVISVPRGIITAPQGIITAPEGVITAPEGVITAPEGVITAPEGVITAPIPTEIVKLSTPRAEQRTSPSPPRRTSGRRRTPSFTLRAQIGRVVTERRPGGTPRGRIWSQIRRVEKPRARRVIAPSSVMTSPSSVMTSPSSVMTSPSSVMTSPCARATPSRPVTIPALRPTVTPQSSAATELSFDPLPILLAMTQQ